MIYEPLTKLQCCPTSDGSAAAILASEQFVIDNGLQEKVSRHNLYVTKYHLQALLIMIVYCEMTFMFTYKIGR